ncbi:MAG: hypothetical protein ACKO32_10945 [Planctomycetia bacterium]
MNAFDPFRSLGAVWRLLKTAPLVVIVGGILLSFLSNPSAGLQFALPTGPGTHPDAFLQQLQNRLPLISVVLFLGMVGSLLLSSWLALGHARAIEKAMRTGEDDLGMVFSTGGRFGAMVLTKLISGLIQIGVALPLLGVWVVLLVFVDQGTMENGAAILIGLAAGVVWLMALLYVYLGLMMAVPIAALEPVSAGEAIRRSFQLANGRRWSLLLFALVSGVFVVLGLLACCVGVFLTSAMAMAMPIEAYLMHARPDRGNWWISTGTKTAATDSGWGSQPS